MDRESPLDTDIGKSNLEDRAGSVSIGVHLGPFVLSQQTSPSASQLLIVLTVIDKAALFAQRLSRLADASAESNQVYVSFIVSSFWDQLFHQPMCIFI